MEELTGQAEHPPHEARRGLRRHRDEDAGERALLEPCAAHHRQRGECDGERARDGPAGRAERDDLRQVHAQDERREHRRTGDEDGGRDRGGERSRIRPHARGESAREGESDAGGDEIRACGELEGDAEESPLELLRRLRVTAERRVVDEDPAVLGPGRDADRLRVVGRGEWVAERVVWQNPVAVD